MLYRPGGDDLVAVASLWRARYTEHGAGTSLLIWSDPGPSSPPAPTTAAICTDNPPLARWLWTTFNRRWEPLLDHGLEQAPLQPSSFTESRVEGEHRVACRSTVLTIELVGSDIRGVAVHEAARIMAKAGEDQILVSEITRTLALSSGIVFEDQGQHTLKGFPGQWRLFAYRPPSER